MSKHQRRSVRFSWQSLGERSAKLRRRYRLLPCAAYTQGLRFDWIASSLRFKIDTRTWRHVKRLCRQISKLARKQNAAMHRAYGCHDCAMGGWCSCRCSACQAARQYFRALTAAS